VADQNHTTVTATEFASRVTLNSKSKCGKLVLDATLAFP
jgi:hypothetical protein